MVAGFPYPYEDELLYSLLARYFVRVRPSSKESLNQQLFGCARVPTSIHCPTGLDNLAVGLADHWGFSTDHLIGLLTLYPLHQPFLNTARERSLMVSMKFGKGLSGGYRVLGQRRESVAIPEFLRFCPACVHHERETLGEAYWHRLHQISGIEVCPVHEVWLEESFAPARALGVWHKLITAEQVILECFPRPVSVQEPGRDALLQLARDAAWLLGQDSLRPNPIPLWKRYRFLLREQGLCSYRGKLKIAGLLARFHRMFPNTFLSRIEGTSARLTSGRGILSLIRKPKSGLPPLYHLLMMQFLGKTVEEFFQLPTEPQDFGIGPWPCLNPVAQHYKQLVVTDLSVHVQKDGGRPVGTFSCSCGFEYARVGPDWGPLAQFSYTRVERYGPLWDRMFTRLWSTPEHTLRFISNTVGIAKQNLPQHAARLKLPVWRRENGRAAIPGRKRTWRGRVEPPTASTIRVARENWNALHRADNLSDSELREEHRLYHWLFRHDHIWLVAQPHRQQAGKRTQGPKHRINWSERDEFLAEVIHKAATDVAQNTMPGSRLSENRVIRRSGYRHLIQPNLNRLHKTRTALKQVIMTHAEPPSSKTETSLTKETVD